MAWTIDQARARLARHGQEHVFRFWERLDGAQRQSLLAQTEALDFATLDSMRALAATKVAPAAAAELEPAPVTRLADPDLASARLRGEATLGAGKVAVLLVAGGQGTRLGFDGPKGLYPIGPVTNASLFEIHARKILARGVRHGAALPFYVMTSSGNHASTLRFFEENRFFGLDPALVRFFSQGELPALDPDGRIVLESAGRMFLGPDGHGGVLAALRRSGSLDDMRSRGIETVYYFQVDNPLVEIADPTFLGFHRARGAEMSVKVCAKRDPDEGLGVVVRRGGRLSVVEYTELTTVQKHERLPDGELRFRYGSVAIHLFSLDFLERESLAGLPLHRAHKKVPCVDLSGAPVKPEQPNAFKFERFIFDALPDAHDAAALEFAREDEFSPVKNASGPDSPDTARRDMMEKFARWLAACGSAAPRDGQGRLRHRIEIDPLYASCAAELRERLPHGFRIARDVALGN